MAIATRHLLCLLAAFTSAKGGQSSAACAMDDVTCKLAYELADEIDSGLALIQRHAFVSKGGQSSKVVDVVKAPSKKATAATSAAAHATTKTKMKTPSLGWSGPIFFDPSTMDWYQLIIITALYGYLLYLGSNMIGDGADQLQFFPSISGIVGSVVVPILGAVPDSMMVLFSGLGADAQVSVSTGVGALAGSTVMLLTFPWFVVNMTGSVPVGGDGQADYAKSGESAGMFNSAVTFNKSINTNVIIMVITSLAFLVIQIPAFVMDRKGISTAEQAAAENVWALLGFVLCLLFFIGYIVICYYQSSDDKRLKFLIDAIEKKQVGLAAVLAHQADTDELKQVSNLKKVLKPFYAFYDLDGNGSLGCNEFQFLLKEVGFALTSENAKLQFEAAKPENGEMSLDCFCAWAQNFSSPEHLRVLKSQTTQVLKMPTYTEDDEDEEEEIPEDLADLSPEQQSRAMLIRSCWNMTAGTVVVLLFSDPAVNVFTEWGNRLGISSFYVGFLLAPFASNASELLVAYGMALKKTGKSVTQSFESLVGAACMNNTFVLMVFFILVYFEKLAWQFKAETMSILIIQWMMAVIILSSTTQRKFMGFVILSLYPLCLVLVYVLENYLGWD